MKRVNVDGTRNIIDACARHGVEKLIYTSTASVAFDGSEILYKNEEQLGYASFPVDPYTGTKVRYVLFNSQCDVNGIDNRRTDGAGSQWKRRDIGDLCTETQHHLW